MSLVTVSLNEHGVQKAHYRCDTCGEPFSVTPAPETAWPDCLGPECASYDPARDVDKWFDEGRVRAIPDGDGRSRLVPYRVFDGGKP